MDDIPQTTLKTYIAEQMRTTAIRYSLEADVWEERRHKATVHALTRDNKWLCNAIGDLEREYEKLKEEIVELRREIQADD